MNVPLPNLISFWKKKTETNSFLSCELWTAPIRFQQAQRKLY